MGTKVVVMNHRGHVEVGAFRRSSTSRRDLGAAKSQRRIARLLGHFKNVDEGWLGVRTYFEPVDLNQPQRCVSLRRNLTDAGGEDDGVEDTSSVGGRLVVQIGNVCVPLQTPRLDFMVPRGYLRGIDLSKLIKIASDRTGTSSPPNDGYSLPQETLRSLQFMMKKQLLGQDIFLIGPPGPARRRLAMQFCELTQREVEYLCLSQDITESDIKQRREVQSKTVFYMDSASVKAALEGRVLVLDGIEKAERNVLPIINNLLENREMALEDGRFICEPGRFDNLVAAHGSAQVEAWKLVKAHPDFFVIALGLPVPPYFGNSLDPPLRSRFQAHAVLPSSLSLQVAQIKALAPHLEQQAVEKLLGVAQVFHEMAEDKDNTGTHIPAFPGCSVAHAALLIETVRVKGASDVPAGLVRQALDFVYPYARLPVGACIDEGVHGTIMDVYEQLGLSIEDRDRLSWLRCREIVVDSSGQVDVEGLYTGNLPRMATVHLDNGAHFQVPCGSGPVASHFPAQDVDSFTGTSFVGTAHQTTVFMECLQAHAVGDFCVVGAKGVGKSVLVREFARALGYDTTLICMYKDMTTRDLFERRNTKDNGDTYWMASALVEAAMSGNLAILDGLDMVHPGTIASLGRLVHDRELTLPSGDRLLSKARFQTLMTARRCTSAELTSRGIYPIHPSFRIIAITRQPNVKSLVPGSSWLTAETCALFHFVYVREFSKDEELAVIKALCSHASPDSLQKLLNVTIALRENSEDEVLGGLADSLSTRALLRIAKRLDAFPEDACLYTAVHRACVSRFLPAVAKGALEQFLKEARIAPRQAGGNVWDDAAGGVEDATVGDPSPPDTRLVFQEVPIHGASSVPGTPSSIVRLGSVQYTVLNPVAPLLVPDILFYENQRQAVTLKDMLQDWKNGDHLLLIGNQGVGKNKLADFFLQKLKLPREYIQLHRDTTVNQLTTQPSIQAGVLVFEDSPLVRAVREGYVLVIDEADKAPTHVTAILKALAEDKEMLLADGRRITAKGRAPVGGQVIPMHPNFRMIVLANRPGYPFLGNDFYKGVGSVFSTFAVDNPDTDSELSMLRKYGPDVPEPLLLKLVAAFNELRNLVDEGQILYPYSTRELVNVVRHIQAYPHDNVGNTLRNVFDFDMFSHHERDILEDAFRRQGIMINMQNQLQVDVGLSLPLPPLQQSEVWTVDAQNVQRKTFSREPLTTVRDQLNGATAFTLVISDPIPLNITNARADSFQEVTSLFQLPVRGPVLGTEAMDNGHVVVVSRVPGGVEIMDVDIAGASFAYVDPFLRLPGAGTTFRPPPNIVQLSVLSGRSLVLYDCLDHSFCVINFETNTSMHASTSFPRSGKRSHAVIGLSRYGVVGAYMTGESVFLSIDITSGKLTKVAVPFLMGSAHAVDLGLWLVESVSGDYYALHIAVDGQPTFRLAPILRSQRAPSSEGSMTYISEKARALSIKVAGADSSQRLYTQSYRVGTIVQLIPGLASTLSAMRGNPVHVYVAPRSRSLRVDAVVGTTSLYLAKTGQLATVQDIRDGRGHCLLELSNVAARFVRHIHIPVGVEPEDHSVCVHMSELPDGSLLLVDQAGLGRLLEVDMNVLQESLKAWGSLNGTGSGQNEQLGLRIATEESATKGGAFQGTNDSNDTAGSRKTHRGSNNGEGEGTGEGASEDNERDGRGSGRGKGTGSGSGKGDGSGSGGGKGGGGKGDGKGGDEASDVLPSLAEAVLIDEVSRELKQVVKDEVPPDIASAAKAAKEAAWQRVLEKLKMSEGDMQTYREYRDAVAREIRELRVVLESLEAKKNERQWLNNKDVGDIDDRRLIDGLTGDRNIYRLRGEVPPEPGSFQALPKRLYFLFDLSMSMSRYSMDGRLLRSLQSAVMIMESFKGFENKYEYSILGHSGDTDDLVLAREGVQPANDRERLLVVRKMNAHTEICDSGDNTLRACQKAIQQIVERDADEHVVFLLSDANLDQYGIGSDDLIRLLNQDKRVRVFILFIGSIGDQAIRLAEACPAGQVFVALDTKEIPKILKQCLLFVSQ